MQENAINGINVYHTLMPPQHTASERSAATNKKYTPELAASSKASPSVNIWSISKFEEGKSIYTV